MAKAWKVISTIISVILTIVLIIMITIYLLLSTISKTFTKSNVKKITSNVSISDIAKENDVFNDIYITLEEKNVDANKIDKLLDSKYIKDIFGTYCSEYIDYLLKGNSIHNITSEELETTINKVLNEAELNLEEKETIKLIFEEQKEKIINLFPTQEQISVDYDIEDLKIIRFIFNGSLTNTCIIICLIIALIIGLINWSLYKFSIYTGIACVIPGGIFTLISMSLESLIKTSSNLSSNLIPVFSDVMKIMKQTSIIVLVLGIIQIIYYVYSNKQNKQLKIIPNTKW